MSHFKNEENDGHDNYGEAIAEANFSPGVGDGCCPAHAGRNGAGLCAPGTGLLIETEIFGPEQTLEGRTRVDLGRHRSLRRTPGETIGVSTTVTGIAIPDRARIFATKFKR